MRFRIINKENMDNFNKIGENMVQKLKNPMAAAPLFAGWAETMITSCLTGTMGGIYAQAAENPTAALAYVADFGFLAGAPEAALVRFAAEFGGVLVPQTAAWAQLIEKTLPQARRAERYAIKKEDDCFDAARLEAIRAACPDECTLSLIDEELYHACLRAKWSADLVRQYPDFAAFSRLGLGIVLHSGGELRSGASSYTSYPGGIEIEIDTAPDCRRRGYALICGAALILECRARGLYPSWDAYTRASVALAEKLGYHFDRAYPVYELD